MSFTTSLAVRAASSLSLLACVSLSAGCGDAEGVVEGRQDGRRNLLLVTIDTMRADHVGAYGYPIDTTPVLDDMARRGVLFEDVYAPMPQTLPAHATIMTGLDPRQHFALENSFSVNQRLDTLAEMLGAQGYATAAYIGALVLAKGTGMGQGFDVYDQPISGIEQQLPGPAEREADETTERALVWADEADPERPFFLWIHYYDPHFVHVAPRRYRREVPPLRVRDEVVAPLFEALGYGDPEMLMRVWHGYAAEVRFSDVQLGRLVDGLEQRGLMQDTVIAVVGDHGEGLYQHRDQGHGLHLWEEQVRVPFVLVHPDGEQAGTRVAGPVMLRDVLPTLLRMTLGKKGDGNGDARGLDLWSLVAEGRSLPERPVFLEQPHHAQEVLKSRLLDEYAPGYQTAVLLGRQKLLRFPDGSQKLFDLEQDALELQDQAASQPESTERLGALLDHWLETNDISRHAAIPKLSDERTKALKALGYLGDG